MSYWDMSHTAGGRTYELRLSVDHLLTTCSSDRAEQVKLSEGGSTEARKMQELVCFCRLGLLYFSLKKRDCFGPSCSPEHRVTRLYNQSIAYDIMLTLPELRATISASRDNTMHREDP